MEHVNETMSDETTTQTTPAKAAKKPRRTPAQQEVLTVIETLGGSATEDQLRTAGADVRAANSLVRKSVLTKEDGPTFKLAAPAPEATGGSDAEGAIEGAGDVTAEAEAHVDAAPALAIKIEDPTRYCLCGCGTEVTHKRSRFAPGHDSRLHALVRKIERGEATLDVIPANQETRDYLIRAPWMAAKHPGVLAQLQGQPAPAATEPASEEETVPAACDPIAAEPAPEAIEAVEGEAAPFEPILPEA